MQKSRQCQGVPLLSNMVTEQRLRFLSYIACSALLLMKTITMQLMLWFASLHQTGNNLQKDPTTCGSEPFNQIWDHWTSVLPKQPLRKHWCSTVDMVTLKKSMRWRETLYYVLVVWKTTSTWGKVPAVLPCEVQWTPVMAWAFPWQSAAHWCVGQLQLQPPDLYEKTPCPLTGEWDRGLPCHDDDSWLLLSNSQTTQQHNASHFLTNWRMWMTCHVKEPTKLTAQTQW